MSSPVHDDLDKRAMYAPPWARETPKRPPQAIVAAVERLRHERIRSTARSSHDDDAAELQGMAHQEDLDQQELPLEELRDPIDIETAMAHAVRATWTPPLLEPVTMPEPPPPRLGGPSWAMVARLGGAAGVAAAVALVVAGAVPLPSIDVSLHANEGARAASALARVFGAGDGDEPKQAPVSIASPVAPLPPVSSVAPSPPVAPAARAPSSDTPRIEPTRSDGPPPAAVPSDIRTAFASLEPPATAAAPVPTQRTVASAPETPAAAAPQVPEHRTLDRDEIAGLLKRGQKLLGEGDIASARLLLRRAAEAGEAEASLALARTYDRMELARLNVIGVVHDHAQAKIWYAKAVAQGSAEAVRRLQQLAQRTD